MINFLYLFQLQQQFSHKFSYLIINSIVMVIATELQFYNYRWMA